MRQLFFKNNVHNHEPVDIPGHGKSCVNLTVRKGLKWSTLTVGEEIVLRDASSEGYEPFLVDGDERAIVFDTKVMTFNDLIHYGKMLELEHDPECRTFTGLHSVMRKVYDGFLPHELVTLVFYEPTADGEYRETS